jgi:CRP-like cAMP-binding protein
VEQYFAYEFQQKSNPNLIEYKELIDYLPHGLREEVKYQTSKQLLQNMFSEFDSENFLRKISTVLKPVIFLPGDFIISKGEIGDKMFFLAEGRAYILLDDKQTIVDILNKGDFFGEHALFVHSKRPTNVQADSFCVVNTLNTCDFELIAKQFPEIQEKLKDRASKTLTALSQIEDPSDEDPEPVKFTFMSPTAEEVDEKVFPQKMPI